MTTEIITVIAILVIAVILFVTERLPMDIVALMVLVSLALTGLLTPAESLAGFSSPAVVTVWAMFILSGGLERTGVANVVGRQVLRLAGTGEIRLLVVIMLTAGAMSAFMNNVGVAAMMLPVVMDIARRTARAPSKLLIPLAFGSLLGGLITLISTPPNILISDALSDNGLAPFQLFDFAPVGLIVMLTGIAFMALVGRHLLPTRDSAKEQFAPANQTDLKKFYDIRERMCIVRLPEHSQLTGKTLAQSRLGSALGLNVIAILRNGETQLAPGPDAILRSGDSLLVEGQLDRLSELRGRQHLIVEDSHLDIERLMSAEIGIADLELSPKSSLLGQTLQQSDFRRRYGVIILAIWRDGVPKRTNFDNMPMQTGDILLAQGLRSQLDALKDDPEFLVSSAEQAEVYRLHERLLIVSIPSESTLVGKTLLESHLTDTFGLTVLGIIHKGSTQLLPAADEQLRAGDALLVKGDAENLTTLHSLQDLEIDRHASLDLKDFESEQIGLTDVVLSPYTTLAGKTLRQIHFRAKYGLNVLAIWRGGQTYRSNLSNMLLRFGDALLLYGPREKLRVLASERDFLVLTEEAQETPNHDKAPLAVLVMLAILLPVILGWVPIAIAAVAGVVLMIVTGCLTTEEAYRYIQWKAVFLIAGMLPLGTAMQQTGAASLLAEGVVNLAGGFGPLAVVAGLYILATISTQVMPNAAVAVLLAPIALSTASNLGISPHALMMTVAIAASASFLSPVAHPANLLIMGPGRYRFTDYLKVGIPLTIIVLIVVLLVLPIFWPL